MRLISIPVKGKHRYSLDGKPVTLTEAADILDVGLVTILRHTKRGVIDAAAIRALTPVLIKLPERKAPKALTPPMPAKPKRQLKRYACGGDSLTIPEWAERTGIPAITLRGRIQVQGWDIERALTQPLATASADSKRRNHNRRAIARIASAFHEARA